MEHWNRCDVCGKFISFESFDAKENPAIRRMLTPDSEFTKEEWETLCPEHANLSHDIYN